MSLLVGSIDFGTTYSGWAYLTSHDFEREPTKAYARNWNLGDRMSLKS